MRGPLQFGKNASRFKDVDPSMLTATAELSLTILDNTDENVWKATDASYDVTNWVGTQSGSWHFLWSSGNGILAFIQLVMMPLE